MIPPSPDIIFLKVYDNTSKLSRLLQALQHHFIRGDRIAIAVANETTAQYLDELLWSQPSEVFYLIRLAIKPLKNKL